MIVLKMLKSDDLYHGSLKNECAIKIGGEKMKPGGEELNKHCVVQRICSAENCSSMGQIMFSWIKHTHKKSLKMIYLESMLTRKISDSSFDLPSNQTPGRVESFP